MTALIFGIINAILLCAMLSVGRVRTAAISLRWTWLPFLVAVAVCGQKANSSWWWSLGLVDYGFLLLLNEKFRVGRIGGVAIWVQGTFFILLCGLAIWGTRVYSSWLWSLGFVVGVFILVAMHDFGHVFAAMRIGQKPKEVLLEPLGAYTQVDSSNRWQTELLIASAGLGVNALLIPILNLLRYWIGYRYGGNVSDFFWRLELANMALLLFNLLPVWPLDGGRVVQAVLVARLGFVRGRYSGAVLSIVIVAGAVVLLLSHHYVRPSMLLFFFPTLLLSQVIFVNINLLNWCLKLLEMERKAVFHDSAICPYCHSRAFDESNAACRCCGHACNAFLNGGRCWNCNSDVVTASCRYCGGTFEIAAWFSESQKNLQQASVAQSTTDQ